VNTALRTHPVRLGFDLQRAPNFDPPPAIENLGRSVMLDLARGCQMLWTVALGRSRVSYACLELFIDLSAPGPGLHRFSGSRFGTDAELATSFSSTFAKLIGLAFMQQYAGTCWVAELDLFWRNGLQTKAGKVDFSKKRPKEHGPDYIAAPFDPTKRTGQEPYYALEFKGRKAPLTFTHKAFRAFAKQAENIQVSKDRRILNLKSWVLLYNYGFVEPIDSREICTLLVSDPESAPRKPRVSPEDDDGSWIIREHLARQCLQLGAAVLAPLVRAGIRNSVSAIELPVYRVAHPELGDRRYIGRWFLPLPDGEMLPMPICCWPELSQPSADRLIVELGGATLADIRFVGGSPESLVDCLFSTPPVFVGQDANMLRACLRTAPSSPLTDEVFSKPQELFDRSGANISLLANGSIVANASSAVRDPEWLWNG
jgi:hypothetical protein